jgi:opacity protein-like surface antigen
MIVFNSPFRAGISLFLLVSSGYASGVLLEKDSPTPISPWQLEFGTRYWLSSGKYVSNLDDTLNNMVSRLTYDGTTGNAAEAFWKVGHVSGLFLKGYLGGGSLDNGHLLDEDFPPLITPYSRTLSEQKNGALNYFSVDFGYDLFTYKNWQLGAFIGYLYWNERYNTFGCQQTATNAICLDSDSIPTEVNTLNNHAQWNSLRLGAISTLDLTTTLNITTDLAYIHSNLNAYDFHNLRAEIRGLPEDGVGNGVQLDAILNWAFNPDLTFGIGGRWWYIATKGFDRFEETFASGVAQPLAVQQSRYGLLLQANYGFDKNSNSILNTLDYSWPGLYIGGNLGYGTNSQISYIVPESEAAESATTLPNNLQVQNSGFIGGGQIGYNWQKNKIIAGLEGDIDYAHLSGASGITSSINSVTTSLTNSIHWLGTLRARLGTLVSNQALVYLTAGPALGEMDRAFDERILDSSCELGWCSSGNNTSTQLGWTAGAGIEYAMNSHASIKAEYLYLDLGNMSSDTIGESVIGSAIYQINSRFNSNTFRLGFNYKI